MNFVDLLQTSTPDTSNLTNASGVPVEQVSWGSPLAKTAVAVGVGGLAVSGVLGLAGLTHNMRNDELGAMVHPVNMGALDRSRGGALWREALADMEPAV